MKLYIFKPSDHWSHCGGAYIVSGNSFKDIVKDFSDESHILHKKDSKNYNYDHWILVKEFEVPEIIKSEIILDNYNWA